jgi:hypothetical protein
LGYAKKRAADLLAERDAKGAIQIKSVPESRGMRAAVANATPQSITNLNSLIHAYPNERGSVTGKLGNDKNEQNGSESRDPDCLLLHERGTSC